MGEAAPLQVLGKFASVELVLMQLIQRQGSGARAPHRSRRGSAMRRGSMGGRGMSPRCATAGSVPAPFIARGSALILFLETLVSLRIFTEDYVYLRDV